MRVSWLSAAIAVLLLAATAGAAPIAFYADADIRSGQDLDEEWIFRVLIDGSFDPGGASPQLGSVALHTVFDGLDASLRPEVDRVEALPPDSAEVGLAERIGRAR